MPQCALTPYQQRLVVRPGRVSAFLGFYSVFLVIATLVSISDGPTGSRLALKSRESRD